jgi:DNA end-binding protein Ku
LKLSLVSVPVKAYSAVSSDEGRVHLHQLHRKCNSRIKYTKTCPIHGPVPNDEIVSGYEYAKGQYVVISEDEIDKLRSESDKAINVVAVVPWSAIDPILLTERTSYLLPDGPVGQKAFALIEKSLTDEHQVAIARIVRQGSDESVVVRPVDGLLAMTTLTSASVVKSASVFKEEIPKASVSAEEMKLTKTLLQSFHRDEIDLTEYHDQFAERVSEFVEARVAGKEVVSSTPTEEPEVINLMDALRKSVAQAKSTHVGKAPTPSGKRKSASRSRSHSTEKPKRKTG